MDDSIQAALEHLARAVAASLPMIGEVREVILSPSRGRRIALPMPGGAGDPDPLTPTEAAIVAAMRGKPPAKATVIASRAGQVYNANYRRTFKGLQRRGIVEAAPDSPHHYRLCNGA